MVQRIVFKFFIVITIFTACETNELLGPNEPVAFAGPDQTCEVGQYVIMRTVCSAGRRGGKITQNEWTQDENNPVKVNFFFGGYGDYYGIGFTKEGIYKFTLRIKDNVQYSAPDEVVIRVKPRQRIIFEDPSLELNVRYELKKPVEDLTDTDLLSLNSLSFRNIGDKVTSLNGIEKCKNLMNLNMSHQKIIDLSPIENSKKITQLTMEENPEIKDFSYLSGLTQLHNLSMKYNEITDISFLENLNMLTYLNIERNNISDISPVVNMSELEELWASNNRIADILPLSYLTNLKLLRMNRCQILDISPLKNLRKLSKVNLSENLINDISSLENLTQLKHIDFSSCSISDISPLRDLTGLLFIALSFNHIEDILPLVYNDGLGNRDYMELVNNPLNEKSVNEYIPELRARGVRVLW